MPGPPPSPPPPLGGRRRVAGLRPASRRRGAGPARAWTPKTQVVIATEAARLAPPDLYRQIDRHRKRFQDGVMAPFEDADPNRHFKDPDGTGSLDRVIVAEVERAIRAIQALRPFEDVVFQLGVVSHYVADAENPLNTSAADPAEGRYFADYARYLERAEPRLPVIFYGLRPGFDAQADPSPLVADDPAPRPLALSADRPRVPADRLRLRDSTASTTARPPSGWPRSASATRSRDVGLMMRYIWIRAGGADFRTGLPTQGQAAMRLPR